VGEIIPEAYYQAVADVLAYIYRLDGKRRRNAGLGA
jgi:type III secretion system FlhB-like substrate exporter